MWKIRNAMIGSHLLSASTNHDQPSGAVNLRREQFTLIRPDPFWTGKRVLVAGGAGFIGSHLVETLAFMGAHVRVADSFTSGSKENLRSVLDLIEIAQVDLTNYDYCLRACSEVDVVMNLAAKVAGVAYNSSHSAEMFDSNVRIGMNLLDAARQNDVDRFLCVSSACVYSREASIPTREEEGFIDDPEPSNLGYGWAKRTLEVQSRLYSNQYGMKIAIVRPFNTYGPRDHFDVQHGHVIPSLISRIIGGENPLVVWGSGRQTRSFVYVGDVVHGMILAAEKHPFADPVNIGSNEEVSIRELAHLVMLLAGGHSSVAFDESKPAGQPRRCPDVSKAKSKLDFESSTSLKDGLKQTIEWAHDQKLPRQVL